MSCSRFLRKTPIPGPGAQILPRHEEIRRDWHLSTGHAHNIIYIGQCGASKRSNRDLHPRRQMTGLIARLAWVLMWSEDGNAFHDLLGVILCYGWFIGGDPRRTLRDLLVCLRSPNNMIFCDLLCIIRIFPWQHVYQTAALPRHANATNTAEEASKLPTSAAVTRPARAGKRLPVPTMLAKQVHGILQSHYFCFGSIWAILDAFLGRRRTKSVLHPISLTPHDFPW